MKSVLDEGLYWRFSLAVYPQKDVASSCLALQARIALDVNVLLMALLAARWHQRVINQHEIGRADALVSCWRAEVVVALREVRSRLKHGPVPAPDARSETLRNEIKAAELHAEQIQQQELAKWIDALDTRARVGPRGAPSDVCQATAKNVVDTYLGQQAGAGEATELYGWADIVAMASVDYRDPLL